MTRKRKADTSEVEKLKLLVMQMGTALRERDHTLNILRKQNDNLLHAVDTLQKKRALVGSVRQRQIAIEDLPDHLLLRIFSSLPPMYVVEVLTQVSQRWRTLCKDPSLWALCSMQYGYSKGTQLPARILERVLSVAPLLDTLECGLSPADPPSLLRAIETTPLVTTHLCLDLDTCAAEAVLRLLCNSSLALQVFCLREGPTHDSKFSDSQALRFWHSIEEATDLTTLSLLLSQTSGLATCIYSFRPRPKATLRKLFVDVGVVDDRVECLQLSVTLTSLLKAHRATLQQVHLPMRVPTPGAVEATSLCPRLTKASVPATTEVRCLSKCARLQDLRIIADSRPNSPRIDQGLLNVGQLRHLRELRLMHLPSLSGREMKHESSILLSTLNTLEELRHLSMTCPPTCSALMDLADTPLSAPHLQVLTFSKACGDVEDGDSACCLSVFSRLLETRPSLHVALESINPAQGDPQCAKLHITVSRNNPKLPVVFVSHRARECATCRTFFEANGSVMELNPSGILWSQLDVVPCRPSSVPVSVVVEESAAAAPAAPAPAAEAPAAEALLASEVPGQPSSAVKNVLPKRKPVKKLPYTPTLPDKKKTPVQETAPSDAEGPPHKVRITSAPAASKARRQPAAKAASRARKPAAARVASRARKSAPAKPKGGALKPPADTAEPQAVPETVEETLPRLRLRGTRNVSVDSPQEALGVTSSATNVEQPDVMVTSPPIIVSIPFSKVDGLNRLQEALPRESPFDPKADSKVVSLPFDTSSGFGVSSPFLGWGGDSFTEDLKMSSVMSAVSNPEQRAEELTDDTEDAVLDAHFLSPRRNQSRACRPISLTENEGMDGYMDHSSDEDFDFDDRARQMFSKFSPVIARTGDLVKHLLVRPGDAGSKPRVKGTRPEASKSVSKLNIPCLPCPPLQVLPAASVAPELPVLPVAPITPLNSLGEDALPAPLTPVPQMPPLDAVKEKEDNNNSISSQQFLECSSFVKSNNEVANTCLLKLESEN